MSKQKATTRSEQIQNLLHRLNADSYALQVKKKKSRKGIKQFSPCPKALEILDWMNKKVEIKGRNIEPPFIFLVKTIQGISCECHSGWDEQALWEAGMDLSYRDAHTMGDQIGLYPSLYPEHFQGKTYICIRRGTTLNGFWDPVWLSETRHEAIRKAAELALKFANQGEVFLPVLLTENQLNNLGMSSEQIETFLKKNIERMELS